MYISKMSQAYNDKPKSGLTAVTRQVVSALQANLWDKPNVTVVN